jgi:hypothetical protein
MTAPIAPVCASAAWLALAEHQQKIRNLHLRELFAHDTTRRMHGDRGGRPEPRLLEEPDHR